MGRNEDNRIGLFGAIAYIVGNIIGTGIFVAPKGILEHVGSVGLSLFMWVFCALTSMLSAINFIELGTSIPESGAEMAYINYLGWYPIGFSVLWLCAVVQSSCSGAILFVTFGDYIMQSLDPVICFSDKNRALVVHFCGFGFMFSNLYSLRKIAGKIQIISMVAKIGTLSWIIGIGFYFIIFKGYTSHFAPSYAFNNTNWKPSALVLATYSGGWAYSGYTTLNFGTEEIQLTNFAINFPRAVVGGLTLVSVVYLLTNIAYFAVLSPQEILKSDAVATLFIQKTIGQEAAYFMPGLIGLLLIGTMNSDIFAWSRFMLAGGRQSMMPSALALVHPENDSPRVAVLAHTFLCVGFSFLGNVDVLINIVQIVGMFKGCFTILALVIIKWKEIPVAKTALKFSIFWPILNLIIQMLFLGISFYQTWKYDVIGLGLFLIGCAVYYLIVFPKKKPKLLLEIDLAITKFFQLLLWTIVDPGPEYQKESEENKKDSEVIFERF